MKESERQFMEKDILGWISSMSTVDVTQLWADFCLVQKRAKTIGVYKTSWEEEEEEEEE